MLWIGAHFTVSASVTSIASAFGRVSVVLAEVVAHDIVRVFHCGAKRMLFSFPAPYAGFYLVSCEALDALLADLSSVWGCTIARTIIVALGLGMRVAHLLLVRKGCISLKFSSEAVRVLLVREVQEGRTVGQWLCLTR